MQIYVHEPREDRRTGLLTELRAGKIIARPIEDAFLRLRPFPAEPSGQPWPRDPFGRRSRRDGPDHGAAQRPDAATRWSSCAISATQAETAELLDRGADEVLVAPIKAIELKARVNAILRRSHGHASDAVKVGNIVAYFDGRDPEVAGTRMRLSQREHAVFKQLALNASKVVPKSAIYDAVYGISEMPPFEKVIDVYICKIRKKLDAATPGGGRYIETVPGRGYRFSDDALIAANGD
jgi:two-component system cell cycle response regulator CtrA